MTNKLLVLLACILASTNLHTSQVAQQKINVNFTQEQIQTIRKPKICNGEFYQIYLNKSDHIDAYQITSGPLKGKIFAEKVEWFTGQLNFTREPLDEQYFYELKKLHEKYHLTKKQQ